MGRVLLNVSILTIAHLGGIIYEKCNLEKHPRLRIIPANQT